LYDGVGFLPSYRLILVLALNGGLLIGCTGEGPSLVAGMADAGGGTAGEARSTPDIPGFNPFSDAPASTAPAREVIANPSLADIMQTGRLPDMALGRPDAPVTIIKYASLTCPYCRKFQLETFPQLKREYIDTGKVRFIIREFPIGHQSGLATIALRCAPPDKYFDLYHRFMAQQSAWVSQEVRPDPIFKIATQVGMTRAQFDTCRQNRGMIADLNWIKERGRKLGVVGTPNFFINGKLVKSLIGIEDIRAMVDPVLAGRVAASAPDPKAR
jgi:protein-disulfide isomerase